jgi:hypothetical protein
MWSASAPLIIPCSREDLLARQTLRCSKEQNKAVTYKQLPKFIAGFSNFVRNESAQLALR